MTTHLFEQISALATEQRNADTHDIDIAGTPGILSMINEQDMIVPLAVQNELAHIATAVDAITERFRHGGRLFYIGAGTSGRLGVVDASECPPTFGVPPTMVQGIIAGGNAAMFAAQEGAEDSVDKGAQCIADFGMTPDDTVCGIAASGRTPFVVGALREAMNCGIYTILVTTNTREHLNELGVRADCIIAPQVGPEVIAGSTRMKSGTAQKLVLNMLTTASMIRLGKTYNNIMVDLQLTNAKLRERAKKIVMDICGCDYPAATELVEQTGGSVKTAIVMGLTGATVEAATDALSQTNGVTKEAVRMLVTNR